MTDVSEYLKILTSAFGALTFTFASLVAAANPVVGTAPVHVATSQTLAE